MQSRVQTQLAKKQRQEVRVRVKKLLWLGIAEQELAGLHLHVVI